VRFANARHKRHKDTIGCVRLVPSLGASSRKAMSSLMSSPARPQRWLLFPRLAASWSATRCQKPPQFREKHLADLCTSRSFIRASCCDNEMLSPSAHSLFRTRRNCFLAPLSSPLSPRRLVRRPRGEICCGSSQIEVAEARRSLTEGTREAANRSRDSYRRGDSRSCDASSRQSILLLLLPLGEKRLINREPAASARN